jgi:flagellar biogenesis protein FliO
MLKYLGLVSGIVVGLVTGHSAFANSLTVRDIKLLGQDKIEIQLDGVASKGALEVEYVRDIVQFSIQNATIYPAKILHSEENSAAFSKVFAYQYAPNLVRVRFNVDGKADQFAGKVKWVQNGKFLTVSFPEKFAKNTPKKEDESTHERSLLAKVLGRTSASDQKVEKIEDSQVINAKAEAVKAESVKAEAAKIAQEKSDASKAEAKAEAKFEAAAIDSENPEAKILLRTDKHKNSENKLLGGAPKGASPIRAFLAMLLVVGGLGMVLLYVKKKKNTAQAKKVGDSWISNLLGGQKKQKAMIEVMATYPLGPKQSITVVRIRGQQLVLGVTEGNVQLITQLDSDEDIDVMDDPKIADSIGKIFGGKPAVTKRVNPVEDAVTASFGSLLKNSTGAGAIVARNAYAQNQNGTAPQPIAPRIPVAEDQKSPAVLQNSVRDQIKQRLQGMRN